MLNSFFSSFIVIEIKFEFVLLHTLMLSLIACESTSHARQHRKLALELA